MPSSKVRSPATSHISMATSKKTDRTSLLDVGHMSPAMSQSPTTARPSGSSRSWADTVKGLYTDPHPIPKHAPVFTEHVDAVHEGVDGRQMVKPRAKSKRSPVPMSSLRKRVPNPRLFNKTPSQSPVNAPSAMLDPEHPDFSIPRTLVFYGRHERPERTPRRANPGSIDARHMQQQYLYYLRHHFATKRPVVPLLSTPGHGSCPPEVQGHLFASSRESGPPAIPAFARPVPSVPREVRDHDRGHFERVTFHPAPIPVKPERLSSLAPCAPTHQMRLEHVASPAGLELAEAYSLVTMRPDTRKPGSGPPVPFPLVFRLMISSLVMTFLRVILGIQATLIALRMRPSITYGLS